MSKVIRWCCHVALLCGLAVFAVAQQHETASAEQVWGLLLDGNHRFVAGKTARHNLKAQRKQVAKSQHPHVVVLSCSDSRVPPELIFDSGLGELFVVRSAGEDDDPISIGSIEYAVEHLGSTVIIVMGHQSCGAVAAACSGEKVESPNLDAVIAPISPSCRKPTNDEPKSLDLAVRDHVHRVAEDLVGKSELLRTAVAKGELTIIGAYYSLDTGEVSELR